LWRVESDRARARARRNALSSLTSSSSSTTSTSRELSLLLIRYQVADGRTRDSISNRETSSRIQCTLIGCPQEPALSRSMAALLRSIDRAAPLMTFRSRAIRSAEMAMRLVAAFLPGELTTVVVVVVVVGGGVARKMRAVGKGWARCLVSARSSLHLVDSRWSFSRLSLSTLDRNPKNLLVSPPLSEIPRNLGTRTRR